MAALAGAVTPLPSRDALIGTLVLLAGSGGVLARFLFPRGQRRRHDGRDNAAVVHPGNAGEWTHYGNSLHATRYSDLAQITPANAANLEQAWVYHAGML